jgi:hypothetical protein
MNVSLVRFSCRVGANAHITASFRCIAQPTRHAIAALGSCQLLYLVPKD